MILKSMPLCGVIYVLFCVAAFAQYNEQRANDIARRAEEIKAFLTATPRGVGAPISDRDAWDKIAKQYDAAHMIKDAETLLGQPTPERLPETLYMEYFENGNRNNYQTARGTKFGRVNKLAIAECLENQGRFLPALEESIRAICDEPSWVLPAHDANADIYQGKRTYIDLASALTSWELATIDYWLQDKLSTETRQLIRDNIERRTFVPYELSVKEKNPPARNGWVTATHNWNTVCHAGVVGAALALIDDPAQRAWYIASAEKHSEFFLKGFTNDGYCSEGLGYWNYGFGHFVDLGETILQATGKKVNLFEPPIVREIALFGVRMNVAPNVYAAFADCSPTAKPDTTILNYMNRQLGLGLADYQSVPFYQEKTSNSPADFGVMAFPNTATEKSLAETNTELGLRSDFADAGILVARATGNNPNRLSLAIKAGHNAEHHNHNDVGSYTVSLGGKTPLLDAGGEVYTRRTFSAKRYDSNAINSFGHPVPRINDALQITGRQAEGIIIEKTFSDDEDKLAIDLSKAYNVEGLKELTRTVFFNRTDIGPSGAKHPGGQLLVVDRVSLEKAGTFETALVTYGNVINMTNAGQSESFDLLVGDSADEAVRISVTSPNDVNPMPLKYAMTEIAEDMMSRKTPKRLAFSTSMQVKKADIVLVITKASPALIEKYFPAPKEESKEADNAADVAKNDNIKVDHESSTNDAPIIQTSKNVQRQVQQSIQQRRGYRR